MPTFSPYRPYVVAGLTSLYVLLGLTACRKKDDVKPFEGLSANIQRVLPRPVLDDMLAKGLAINKGDTPPNIEGIYLASPYRLRSPFGPEDGWQAGRIIDDYKFRFSEQRGDAVKLDLKQTSEEGRGTGSFLSGSGNRFSLFAETTGTESGITVTKLQVISGEITSSGIKDFQYAFVITKKTGDDGDRQLIPINKTRVWEDANQQADKVSRYRLSADAAPVATVVRPARGSAGGQH